MNDDYKDIGYYTFRVTAMDKQQELHVMFSTDYFCSSPDELRSKKLHYLKYLQQYNYSEIKFTHTSFRSTKDYLDNVCW